MNVAFKAMQFARHVHRAQQRKYTGNPYADHLAEVAGIVAATVGNQPFHVSPITMVAVAWLHDCVEDQKVEESELIYQFGSDIAKGVMYLSDLEVGNRAQRKRASCARLGMAPGWVQTIKCADLLSNMSSIVQHDPEFAELYLREMSELLDAMKSAEPAIYKMARDSVAHYSKLIA